RHRLDRRVFPLLRARRGTSEFRGVDRVHGRERGGADALLRACAGEEDLEPAPAAAGIFDLPGPVAEPEPPGDDLRSLLDDPGVCFWCREAPRFPGAAVV